VRGETLWARAVGGNGGEIEVEGEPPGDFLAHRKEGKGGFWTKKRRDKNSRRKRGKRGEGGGGGGGGGGGRGGGGGGGGGGGWGGGGVYAGERDGHSSVKKHL